MKINKNGLEFNREDWAGLALVMLVASVIYLVYKLILLTIDA